MDFAVIQTGGKQYKVSPGDTLKIEKMAGDFKKGDAITFDKVLLTSAGDTVTVGLPFLDGATVAGIFEEVGRAQKVTVIKYKQKSRYFKKNGHRQTYFKVKIDSINPQKKGR
jgi:large subunit ribosomal protein L21